MAEKPSTSERLWSEECQRADTTAEDKHDYEFTNGRKITSESNA